MELNKQLEELEKIVKEFLSDDGLLIDITMLEDKISELEQKVEDLQKQIDQLTADE